MDTNILFHTKKNEAQRGYIIVSTIIEHTICQRTEINVLDILPNVIG